MWALGVGSVVQKPRHGTRVLEVQIVFLMWVPMFAVLCLLVVHRPRHGTQVLGVQLIVLYGQPITLYGIVDLSHVCAGPASQPARYSTQVLGSAIGGPAS